MKHTTTFLLHPLGYIFVLILTLFQDFRKWPIFKFTRNYKSAKINQITLKKFCDLFLRFNNTIWLFKIYIFSLFSSFLFLNEKNFIFSVLKKVWGSGAIAWITHFSFFTMKMYKLSIQGRIEPLMNSTDPKTD